MQREAEMRRDVEDAALGQRAGLLPHRPQDLRRGLLDLGEVVVPLAHLGAQLRVGSAGHLRRRALFGQQPGELAVEADQRFERVGRQPPAAPDRREAQRRVRRLGLEVGQLDLQTRAAARRLRPQQVLQRYAQRGRDGLQQAQPRLPLAVLDERQLRRRATHGRAELVQRHSVGPAQVSQPLPQRDQVHRAVYGSRHSSSR
jgi:hypothetical protein